MSDDQLVIAIDFDHTYDADHDLFESFIRLIQRRGHQPLLVTKREGYGEWFREVDEAVPDEVPRIFCGKSYKSDVVEEEGWEVDIWVDDSPEFIHSKSALKDRLDDVKGDRHRYKRTLDQVESTVDVLRSILSPYRNPVGWKITDWVKRIIQSDSVEEGLIPKQADVRGPDTDLDQFRHHVSQFSGEEAYDEALYMARTLFPHLGTGSEATVFAIDDERVLKVSLSQKNIRGEYVIFADPQFDPVTPEVYGHGEDWHWMIVERFEPIRSWREVKGYFPNLWTFLPKGDPQEVLNSFLREGGNPPWFENLHEDIRQWVHQVRRLHDRLGNRIEDIRPSNLGVSRDRHFPVLIDIWMGEDMRV